MIEMQRPEIKCVEVDVDTYYARFEVKPLENYNLDPEDYFVEKHQIDKRTNEMLGQKNKTKKLTRKPNVNNMYKI